MTKKEMQRRYDMENRLVALGGITREEADTLRRCSRTLSRWGELECGAGNNWASWAIDRDEATGKPFLVTYPREGKTRRRAIPDREAGALRRIRAIVEPKGLFFYHQTDPRGAAVYVSDEPLTAENYPSRGIPVW